MFVLSQNRSSIILGPMEYDQRYFQSIIKDDLGLDVTLPVRATGYLDLGHNLELFSVTVNYPPANSKIQEFAGPFFVYSGQTCSASYTVVPKPIDSVKSELKAKAAADRYIKEVGGITLTIQGKEVKVLTNRDDRNLYLQALQLGAANVSWKFDNQTWLTLSLAELGDIVAAIMNHVKTCFEQEAAKATQIDSCTTLAQLDAIVFENVQLNPNPIPFDMLP
jgi:hypothetical protein